MLDLFQDILPGLFLGGILVKVSGAKDKQAEMEGVGWKPFVQKGDAAIAAVSGGNEDHSQGVENLESVVNVGFLHRIRLLDWVIILLYGQGILVSIYSGTEKPGKHG